MDIAEYKCPSCGAGLVFDAKNQKLTCPSCGNTYDVETMKAYDESLKAKDRIKWKESSHETMEMNEFICPSCGGVLLSNENTIATHCPYCDNPAVVLQRVSGVMKPDYVIPFKVDKKEAQEALNKHCQGKFLLPKDFISENRLKEIVGIYVPFWLYDSDVESDGAFHATKERHWSDHDYNYTETDHFHVIRQQDMSFTRVPVDGSKRISDTYMESIEPYRYEDLKEFSTTYLSGFVAEKYDVDKNDSRPRAVERMKKTCEQEMVNTIQGYTHVTTEHLSIHLDHQSESYALLPVWMLTTKYNGKYYRFAMNGQTGKFIGELPCDKKKYWLTFAGIALAIIVVVAIVVWGIL